MRWIAVFLVVLLLLLQYRLWVGNGSLPHRAELERQLQAQLEINRHLQARNKALEAEVIDLKTGLEALEERARNELGMTRENETFFMIVEPEAGGAESPRD